MVTQKGLVERELKVTLAGYGPNWWVELNDGGFFEYHNDGWGPQVDLLVPFDLASWERFVRSCDQLGMWRWRRRYPRHGRVGSRLINRTGE